jgi:hypothetical protein
MPTVVRYSLMRSFSTMALIDMTCGPWMPRTVFRFLNRCVSGLGRSPATSR